MRWQSLLSWWSSRDLTHAAGVKLNRAPLVFRADLQDARQARIRAGEVYADAIRRNDTREIHHAHLALVRATNRELAARWDRPNRAEVGLRA